jgi:hypothetical protein
LNIQLFFTALGVNMAALPLRMQEINLSLYLINKASCHEDEWGEWRCNPNIPDFGTRSMRAISLMSKPLYLRGQSTRYPSVSWLGGPREENYLLCVGKRSLALQPIARLYAD